MSRSSPYSLARGRAAVVAAPHDPLVQGAQPITLPMLRLATWLLRESGSGTRRPSINC